MAAHAITLRLPAPLFDHFRARAERAHRSVEAEILDAVSTVATDAEDLPADVARSLADLELMSDDELWRTARHRLSDDTRLQLEALNAKQQRQGLPPVERQLLEQLVEELDRAVLIRAEAARLLKERRHDVSTLLSA